MERNFPEKSLWVAKAEADFEFAEQILLPIFQKINSSKLDDNGEITIKQNHKYGGDSITYYRSFSESKQTRFNKASIKEDIYDTHIYLTWESLEPRSLDYNPHIITLDFTHDYESLSLRTGNPDMTKSHPLVVKVRNNPRYIEDLNLLLKNLLSNPEYTRIR